MGQHLNISTCFCEFYQHCLILDVSCKYFASCSFTLVVLAWYAKCHIMMPIVGGDASNGDFKMVTLFNLVLLTLEWMDHF
jgi:hypothetical protein